MIPGLHVSLHTEAEAHAPTAPQNQSVHPSRAPTCPVQANLHPWGWSSCLWESPHSREGTHREVLVLAGSSTQLMLLGE